jgi:hypothetical protein
MARLVLGVAGAVVGAYFGNPALGFAIGSAIGGAVDPATTKAQGPRLNDLRVQGSAYGAPIPRPYGAMRLAGQVVWSGGIREHQETESQSSKGGPQVETTSYTYTASFAVQLCAGPIGGVRRIWADARLIWSAASDQPLASALASGAIGEKITLYPGTADQEADPLIEADKGVGATPAYRHRALLVFEDLDLAPYGNRIPNIEAEVVSAGVPVVVEVSSRTIPAPAGLTSGNSMPVRLLNDDATVQIVGAAAATNPFPNDPVYISTETTDGPLTTVQWDPPPGFGTFAVLSGGATIAGGTSNRNAWPLHTTKIGSSTKWWLWIDGKAWALDWAPTGGSVCRWRVRDDLAVICDWNGTRVFITKLHEYIWLSTLQLSIETAVIDTGISAVHDLELATGGLYVIGVTGGASVLRYYANPLAETPMGVELWSGAPASGGRKWLLTVAESRIYRVLSGGGANAVLDVHDQVTGAWMASYILPFILGISPGNVMQVKGPLVTFCTGDLVRTLRVISLAALDRIEADLQSVVADLCAEVGVPAVTSALAGRSVPGYVRTRPMSVRAALEPLQQSYWFDLVPRGAQLVAVARGGAPVATLAAEEYVAGQMPELSRADDLELPRRVVVIYRAYSRQYQEGSQQHQRLTGAGQAESVVELPLALDDAVAAQVAEVLLRQAWIEREGLRLQLGPAHLALEPADRLTLALAAGAYTVRLTRVALQPMLRLECEAVVEQATIYTPVSQGAAIDTPGDAVLARGPTALEMIDGPLLRDSDPDGVLYAAGYGLLPDWRGAALQSSSDGLLWHPEGALVQALTNGTLAVAPLATVSPDRVDEASRPEILITRGGLAGVTDALFWASPPALLIGGELIAYRDAEDLGGGLWRLGYLLRALRGTEQAMAHAAGERCLLLDSALRPLAFAAAQLGVARYWRAATLGRTAAPEALILAPAAAGLLPLAPCHLARADLGAGLWAVSWLRRTRRGGAWRDGVDAALGEASEAYRVRVYAGAVLNSEATVATPAATVAGSAGHKVRVAQMSEAAGAGREAEIIL